MSCEVCVDGFVDDPTGLVTEIDQSLVCGPPSIDSACIVSNEVACDGPLDLIVPGTTVSEDNWSQIKALSLLAGVKRIEGKK